MSETKFQVGDRVRVAEDPDFGPNAGIAGQVVKCETEIALVKLESPGSARTWFSVKYLEPAPAVNEPKAPQPEFKVGDRVRVITKPEHSPLTGKLGTVVESDDRDNHVLDRDVYVLASIDGVEASNVWFARCNLELVEPASTVKECLTNDNVNHPPHYNQGGIECLEAIKAALGDGFAAYLRGNVMKYLWRCEHKGGVEDLRKAAFYLDRAIKEMEVTSE